MERNFLCDTKKDSGAPRFRGHCGPPRLVVASHHPVQQTPPRLRRQEYNPVMSLSRLGWRSAKATGQSRICLICQSRQFTQAVKYKGTAKLASVPNRQNTSIQIQIQNYATKRGFNASRVRADVDERGRLGFYTLTKQQGILKMEPRTAQSLYQDFITHKNKMDHGTNVLRLAKSAY